MQHLFFNSQINQLRKSTGLNGENLVSHPPRFIDLKFLCRMHDLSKGVQTAVMYLPHSHHDGTHVTTCIGTSSVSADDQFPQMDGPDQPLMTAVDDQQ
jgi:hypothetical protein